MQTNKQKNKTKQNKTKQNKTKQNKTKQNKTKQNKTKQNKTKQKILYILFTYLFALYTTVGCRMLLLFVKLTRCFSRLSIGKRFKRITEGKVWNQATFTHNCRLAATWTDNRASKLGQTIAAKRVKTVQQK